MIEFTQKWRPYDWLSPVEATAAEIEAEPMFYNAGPDFVNKTMWDLECPLTEQFLDLLFGTPWHETELTDWSLDTRSHMLMPGWYPAIPGWHHDDVDRGADGQPDYNVSPLPRRAIYAMVVDASDQPTGSMTEFAFPGTTVKVPWPLDTTQKPVYGQWDEYLECNPISTKTLKSGVLTFFTEQDFHRAMPATGFGWRWFARLIFSPGQRPAEGKIRRQVQAYLPALNQGW